MSCPGRAWVGGEIGPMQGGGSLSIPQLGSAGRTQAVGWRSAEGYLLIRYQHFIFDALS